MPVFKANQDATLKTKTVLIGIPSHLNQLNHIEINGTDLMSTLENYKHLHIISSNLAQISSSMLHINNEDVRLITVGLDNIKTLNRNDYLKIFGNVFQYLKNEHIINIDILFDTFLAKQVSDSAILELLGLQSSRSIYQFDHYKSDKQAPYQLNAYIQTELKDINSFIEKGIILGDAINLARDYSNMPPNLLTPVEFANSIKNHFQETTVNADIKDENDILDEGLGLLHAVGKGSSNKPRLITLTYQGADASQSPIGLVGKGITYDSGGYSIKSKIGMQTMKYDMCGAANVVGMVEAIRRLELPINVVAVIASAENMISDLAMKPDDIYTAFNGETVEVLNSDAEGRLVLGDAVAYINQYQPRLIMDFATLTGAAIAALGNDKAAVFNSHADEYLQFILNSAKESHEYVFELPITQTEQDLIKNTTVADLVNHTNGQGKALFAATFVTHFSGSTPHLHFDIAGPATINKSTFNGPKGPTGYLITTVVNWIKNNQ